MHPRAMLHRVGDQADLEQVHVLQFAPGRIAGEAARAVTERQAGHCAALQRRRGPASRLGALSRE